MVRRPGRPRKWKGMKPLTIYKHDEYADVWAKAEEIARTTNKSLCVIVEEALTSYVKQVYPNVEITPMAGGLNTIQVMEQKLIENEVMEKLVEIRNLIKIRNRHEKGDLFWMENHQRAVKTMKEALKLMRKLYNPQKRIVKKLMELQNALFNY